MKLSLKAAVFSAIVFPGSGYFLVAKKIQAWLALLSVFGALVFIFVDVYYRANIIAEKIIYGQIPMDYMVIREQILLTPGRISQDYFNGLSIIIGLIWLFSVVDCYLTGKRIEESNK